MANQEDKEKQEKDFDWKGEAGDKFAEWNPPSVEGKNKGKQKILPSIVHNQ